MQYSISEQMELRKAAMFGQLIEWRNPLVCSEWQNCGAKTMCQIKDGTYILDGAFEYRIKLSEKKLARKPLGPDNITLGCSYIIHPKWINNKQTLILSKDNTGIRTFAQWLDYKQLMDDGYLIANRLTGLLPQPAYIEIEE